MYYNTFNQGSHQIILNYDVEEGSFLLFDFAKDMSKKLEYTSENAYKSAVFIQKDKICILEKNKQVGHSL